MKYPLQIKSVISQTGNEQDNFIDMLYTKI